MKRILFLPVFLAAFAIQAQPASDAPRCSTQRECEVMWSDAQEALALVSQMRIRMVSETRIETYPPTTYGRVGAIVTKVPVGEKDYEIRIRLECYRSVPCDETRESGTKLFNLMVQKRKTATPAS